MGSEMCIRDSYRGAPLFFHAASFRTPPSGRQAEFDFRRTYALGSHAGRGRRRARPQGAGLHGSRKARPQGASAPMRPRAQPSRGLRPASRRRPSRRRSEPRTCCPAAFTAAKRMAFTAAKRAAVPATSNGASGHRSFHHRTKRCKRPGKTHGHNKNSLRIRLRKGYTERLHARKNWLKDAT